MPSSRRLLAPALAAVLALGGLAACGSDDSGFRTDGSALDGDPATTLPKELTAAAPATPERAEGEPLPEATTVTGVSTDLSKKPKVPKGNGPAPTELQGTDVVVGKGAEAKAGDTVEVQYVGVLYDNGKQFDASWDNAGKAFEFTIGQGDVIQGWDQGVPGMKVGGRRTLVIPADLAYGAAGSPPTIPADSPLTFVVDLKKVTKG
jgi:peptidylprolyl isomerase